MRPLQSCCCCCCCWLCVPRVLCDLDLLQALTQTSTVTSAVLAADANLIAMYTQAHSCCQPHEGGRCVVQQGTSYLLGTLGLQEVAHIQPNQTQTHVPLAQHPHNNHTNSMGKGTLCLLTIVSFKGGRGEVLLSWGCL